MATLKDDIAAIEAAYYKPGNPALAYDLMAVIRSILDAAGVPDLVIANAPLTDIRAALVALDAASALAEAFASLGADTQSAVAETGARLAQERDAWVAAIDGGVTVGDLQAELEFVYGYTIPEVVE